MATQGGHGQGQDGGRAPSERLARSYLNVRAEQTAEGQPKGHCQDVGHTVRLPRLDSTHLNSPEAQAQYRLALLARLAANGEPWFTLAANRERTRRPG